MLDQQQSYHLLVLGLQPQKDESHPKICIGTHSYKYQQPRKCRAMMFQTTPFHNKLFYLRKSFNKKKKQCYQWPLFKKKISAIKMKRDGPCSVGFEIRSNNG